MTFGRILFGGAIAFSCGALVATGAHACGNGKVIFEDKFETLDPGWGKASDRLSVDNGALVIKAEAGTGRWAMSQSDYYQDAAICVDATVVNVPDQNSGFTAIVLVSGQQQLLRVRLLAGRRHQGQSGQQRKNALSSA